LGSGECGGGAAALMYVNKSLGELTLGEAAFLAGLPKAPNNYNPGRYPQQAKVRRDWVLDRIAEDGAAPEKEIQAARAEPIATRKREEAEIVNGPYFAEEVRRELLARYGEKGLYESGLSVRTSMDGKLQAAADKALRDGLIAYDRGHGGWRGPVGHIDLVLVEPLKERAKPGITQAAAKPAAPAGALYNLCQIPEVSGAIVAMDPHTGRVLAMSGGFSFAISQFNRATQAKRQPGSSIKPFVYLTALEHGFTPSTLVDDSPISIPQGPGMPAWTPANYSGNSFHGPLPLRVALEKSLNTVTARLAAMLGMDAIGETVEKFGIMDHMPRLYSMALGAGETTPLRHTAAYAMLDNGGKRITPTLIDRIQDRNGKTILDR